MFSSEVVRAELLADVQKKGEQMAVKLDKVEKCRVKQEIIFGIFLSIGEGVCQGWDEGGAGNEVLPQGGRRDCARGREVSGGQPSHPRHIGFQEWVDPAWLNHHLWLLPHQSQQVKSVQHIRMKRPQNSMISKRWWWRISILFGMVSPDNWSHLIGWNFEMILSLNRSLHINSWHVVWW